MGSSLRFKYLSFCIDGAYEYEKLRCKRDLALAEILVVVVVVVPRVEDASSFFNTCTCNATQQRVSRVGHGLGKEVCHGLTRGQAPRVVFTSQLVTTIHIHSVRAVDQ